MQDDYGSIWAYRAKWAYLLAVVGALLAMHGIMRNRDFEETARRLSWPLTGLLLAAMLIAILLSPGEERAFIYFEF